MKSKLFMSVLVFLLVISFGATVGYAQDPEDGEDELVYWNTPPNQQVDMDIQIGGTDAEDGLCYWTGAILPDRFRGQPAGVTNVFEDMDYFAYEYSPIFEEEAATVQGDLGTEDPQFVDEAGSEGPSITWVTTEDGEEWEVLDDENSNMARMGRDFREPGNYILTNAGSRQVSYPLNVRPGDEDEEADDDDELEEERGLENVTANASVEVVAHDITPPDLWLGFIEETADGAATLDVGTELRRAMLNQMQGNTYGYVLPALQPEDLVENPTTIGLDLIQQGSVIAAFEYPFQAEPLNKGARVTTYGPLFENLRTDAIRSEEGCPRDLTRNVRAELRDEQAIYVRRNVPFTIGAATTDNSYARAEVYTLEPNPNVVRGEDGFYIYSEQRGAMDRVVVSDDGKSFMFRLPNYPREQFQDQPEYRLLAISTDAAGNKMEIDVAVNVVTTRAFYEGGQR